MAKTVSEQVVGGETYKIADNDARQAIADEVTAREAAVADEATAREIADNDALQAIADEATAREAAIDELKSATISTRHNINVTAIPANANLNGYTTPGNYSVASFEIAATIQNMPTSLIRAGRLTVATLNSDSAILQKYTATSVSGIGLMTAMREFSNGAWLEWMYEATNVFVADNTEVLRYNIGVSAIPANADLNDYTTPGNYSVASGAIAETIQNMPTSLIRAGRLTVATLNNEYAILQKYTATSVSGIGLMTATREYSNGSWQEWMYEATNIFVADNTEALRHNIGVAAIPENADLNDYTTPGNYSVATSAIAATLVNCPTNVGFRLVVKRVNSTNAIRQEITSSLGATFHRVFTSGAFADWVPTGLFLSHNERVGIPENADVNDYTIPGNYVIRTVAISRTLSHYPATQGGTLTVMTISGATSIIQILQTTTSDIYTRARSNAGWTEWAHLMGNGQADTIAQSVYSQLLPLIRSASYDMAFANAVQPLTLKNYIGNTENVHPKVLYFANGFADHKYWMAYTPYPKSNDRFENPCIAFSDDGYLWENIEGNPLDDPLGVGYNSDTHLVYREDLQRLECWYRHWNTETEDKTIYRRVSTNGTTWSERETIKVFPEGVDCLSPAIEWDGTNYNIWSVSANHVIEYYTAPGSNVTEWTKIRRYDNITFTDGTMTVYPWHLDVIKDGNTYIMLVMCRNGTNIENNRCSLFITTSTDNVTYTTPQKVVGGSLGWDKYMYRSSIVKIDGTYKIYYSAGSGGTTSIYNHATWGMAITESQTLSNFYGVQNHLINSN